MSNLTLEERVAAVEAEVISLKKEKQPPAVEAPWWEQIRGIFKDDTAYAEAMRLGREYREAQRPQEDDRDEQAQ
jgi:hypothetical protein